MRSRTSFLPVLVLCGTFAGFWPGSLVAQTDAFQAKTSDGSSQQPRLVVTTSTAGQHASIRVQNGILRLSSTSPVGTSSAGDLRFDSASGTVRYHDGAGWRVIVATDGSGSNVGVLLQGATPGSAQSGHLNVSGKAIAGTALGTSGTIDLPATTTSTAGVLQVAGARFLHAYGTANAFVGASAGNFALTGSNNAAFGAYGSYSNTSGSMNTSVGSYALYTNSTGAQNTAVGYRAGYAITTTGGLTAIGSNALEQNTTGAANTAVGFYALGSNVTGAYNTAVGFDALIFATGNYGTALGSHALYSSTSGGSNVGIGYAALYSTTTGGGNTALGADAGRSNTTGTNNTFVGYLAGNASGAGLANATALGYNAQVAASNSLVLGNGANVGIGTSAPLERLAVVGKATFGDTTFAAPGSEPVAIRGPGAGISIDDRDGVSPRWVLYPSGGMLRFWRTSDMAWIDGSGNLTIIGRLVHEGWAPPLTLTIDDDEGSSTATTWTTISTIFGNLSGMNHTRGRLVVRWMNSMDAPAASGTGNLRLYDASSGATLVTMTRGSGARAWLDVSSEFVLPAGDQAYDLQVYNSASGTTAWRSVQLVLYR